MRCIELIFSMNFAFRWIKNMFQNMDRTNTFREVLHLKGLELRVINCIEPIFSVNVRFNWSKNTFLEWPGTDIFCDSST